MAGHPTAQKGGESAKDGFHSVATAHAKTSRPTAQTGTFSKLAR